MKNLNVDIERMGRQVRAGRIFCRDDSGKVSFCYDEEYLSSPEARAISVSLPLQKESFPDRKTQN